MILVPILLVLVRVAFFTLLERKILGYIQIRKGPNKPGSLGLLVPFADAAKLITKENNIPYMRNRLRIIAIPCFLLLIPIFLWLCYPTPFDYLLFKFSVLYILSVSSIGVYCLLGAGWRSNRKYSFLGAIRAVAQRISYEVCFSLIVLHRILFFCFYIFHRKIETLSYIFWIVALLFLSSLAERNRTPFDFSEGESELVSGYNTEYSSIPFVLFFLSEYISILFLSIFIRALFFSTGLDIFFFVGFWSFLFLWRRGSLPRLRYDQLIYVAWKSILPFTLTSVAIFILRYSESTCFLHKQNNKKQIYDSFCIMKKGSGLLRRTKCRNTRSNKKIDFVGEQNLKRLYIPY